MKRQARGEIFTSAEGLCSSGLNRDCTLFPSRRRREFRRPEENRSDEKNRRKEKNQTDAINRFAVVLSDVDANEGASRHISKERRMTPPESSCVEKKERKNVFSSYFSIRKRDKIIAFSWSRV